VGCDIVVLEVGMGGAMDATNTIPVPEVAVITNIGLDHTGFLGNTVEEIATEKCGIFKDGGAAVVYRSTPGVEEVFEKTAANHGMQLKKADFDSLNLRAHSLEGQVFDCGNRKELELPLLGEHQLHNASVVLSIADTLMEKGWKISEDHIRAGLREVSWPGRFHIVKRDPLFIVDGGHNPQCLESLVQNIIDYLPGRKIVALTGVLADKDYGEMYKPVMPYITQFVCITPPNDRKLESVELAKHLRAAGADAQAAENIPHGVALAQQLAGSDGVVLCFGSLYSIGTIYESL
jgi:dihydrofolate synthase/folylpolyglutamate synthase